MFANLFRPRRTAQPIRRNPVRKPFRPALEGLETRLAPAMIDWISPSSGAWETPENWSTGTVPGADDDVVINTVVTITHSSASTVKSLSFGGGTPTQAPTLTGAGTLNVTDFMNWTSGTMSGSAGSTNLVGGAGLTISGNLNKTLTVRTLNTTGPTMWTGSGNLLVNAQATWNNTGAVSIQTDHDIVGLNGFIVNAGTWTRTIAAGAGFTTVSPAFNNTGTVSVLSGDLNLNATGAGGESTGIFDIAAGSNVYFSAFSGGPTLNGASFTGAGFGRITSGNVNIQGTVAAVNFALDGGNLTGAGTLNVTGVFNWTGGTMSGSGSTNLVGGAALAISGNALKSLTAVRTLNTTGPTTWTGSGNLLVNAQATWNNTGAVSIQTDHDIVGLNGFIVNAGTWTRTIAAGAGLTTVSPAFNNTGTVSVLSGDLNLNATGAGGESTGTFDIAAGSNVYFSAFSGGPTLNGASFTGAGFGRITSGNVNIQGTVAAVNFALDGGNLTGAGTLNVTGAFDWTGGTITNTNGVLVLPAGASLTIRGNTDKTLTGGTLNLNGVTTWSDSGNLSLFGNATINVLSDGAFNIQNDRNLNGTGFLTIAPGGTLNKTSAVAGQTNVAGGITFTNDGTVNITDSRLSFAGAYTQNGGATNLTTTSSNARLLSAGVTLWGGSLSGSGILDGNVTIRENATLSGALTVNGSLTNWGTIHVGGSGAAGTLTVNGGYMQRDSGVLNIEIGGTDLSQYDRLVVNGMATLDGTLNVVLIGGFVPSASGPDTFQVLTCDARDSQFATITGLDLGDGLMFDPQYDATGLTLVTTAI